MRFRRIAVVATGVGSLMLVSAGVAVAASGGGYGPSGPTGPVGAPGGFTSVVTTQSVGAAGGTVMAVVDGATVTVSVPAGALGDGDQVEITQPSLSQVQSTLGNVGFAGYAAVSGIGIKVFSASGLPVSGTFGAPITVRLSGGSLGTSGEKVLEFTGPSSATVVPASLGAQSVVVTLTEDPDLAVVNPTAAAGSTVPGATTQHTGVPLTGDEDLALGLAAAGVLLLIAAAGRRLGRAGR